MFLTWYYANMVSTEKSSAIGDIRFNVRVPPELHARITQLARANGRSMNSEIITLLLRAIENSGDLELDRLQDELNKVQNEIHRTTGALEGLDRRKYALIDEIEERRLREGRPPPR